MTAARSPLLLATAVAMAIVELPRPLQAQQDEPRMEALVLADGDSGSEWTPAEATMEPDDARARDGRAMHLHIDVDYTTGEPAYPIGWPRTYLNMPEDGRDWTGWDFIDFWMYADTSRESFPGTPLGLIIRCPDRNSQWQTNLSDLRKGEWVHFRFPLSQLPDITNVAAVQLFISESNYQHGDVLDFWVDDLRLLRYAEPTIIRLQPLNEVMYRDAGVLRVAVELTGLAAGETAQVEVGLQADGTVIQQVAAPLAAGITTIPLPLTDAAPGTYEAWARVAGTDRTVTEAVRAVSSPWEAVQE